MNILADENIRIDKYISNKFEEIPREKVKDFIKDKKILVDEKKVKPSYKLELGDMINISDELFKKPEIRPEKMDIKIIYENEDYAIIDKDENVMVHPAGSIVTATLVNGLLYKFGYDNLSHIGGDDRPGIVHRLDKDTTGLMLIAKNNKSYKYFKDLFEKRKVDKEYFAICHGIFDNKKDTIETFIDRDPNNRRKMAVRPSGRKAISKYEVIKEANGFSLVKVKILTGRTHQIRVHMTYINHPILGDPVYGNVGHKFNLEHQLLHCHKLGFVDQSGEYKIFETEVHDDFKKYQKVLKLGD
ncbi:RluA family pseudouridine synthase [Anaerococcus porci]|uniref:RluA family pseudouridine synthase n=1 Tax=Anaerococcus porci TaxID=2652269 RepID=UPI002A7631EE|nr:RluA family pseudouridine synthase [Anaerococcus porci]MDY3006671.1 RluA family pseudouridine synthase [Anaerococcus porci]